MTKLRGSMQNGTGRKRIERLLTVAVLVPGVLAGIGVLFCAFALWAARDFARSGRGNAHPGMLPISILKPIKGSDPDMPAALRSHCIQNYSAEVELLVGVQSIDDAEVEVLRELAAEFPRMRIEVFETPLTLGTNGKVSNLAQIFPHARFDHILISDADIAVGPEYLRRVTAPFADPSVGLVTAGYRGRTHPAGRPTLGSRLEALSIATDLFAGVLCARLTDGGMRFGLGSTLLVSRAALAAAGGLEALVNRLADDHDLGRNVSAAGYKVVLSPEPVSTGVPAYRFGEFWAHQLRWARTIKAARPGSYLGLFFTHPVPWAVLFALATGGSLGSLLLLALAVAARAAVALFVGFGLLRDEQVPRDLWLLPLRDCLGLALWVWSYADDTVEWRGERFRVREGRMVRVPK